MKCYIDGNELCIVGLGFDNLQASEAIFIKLTNQQVENITLFQRKDACLGKVRSTIGMPSLILSLLDATIINEEADMTYPGKKVYLLHSPKFKYVGEGMIIPEYRPIFERLEDGTVILKSVD